MSFRFLGGAGISEGYLKKFGVYNKLSSSTADIIVAASDSYRKDKADVVCSGVDDQNCILEASDILKDNGITRGTILLLNGNYYLTDGIDVNSRSAYFSLIGTNRYGTILHFHDNGNVSNAIYIGGYASIANINIDIGSTFNTDNIINGGELVANNYIVRHFGEDTVAGTNGIRSRGRSVIYDNIIEYIGDLYDYGGNTVIGSAIYGSIGSKIAYNRIYVNITLHTTGGGFNGIYSDAGMQSDPTVIFGNGMGDYSGVTGNGIEISCKSDLACSTAVIGNSIYGSSSSPNLSVTPNGLYASYSSLMGNFSLFNIGNNIFHISNNGPAIYLNNVNFAHIEHNNIILLGTNNTAINISDSYGVFIYGNYVYNETASPSIINLYGSCDQIYIIKNFFYNGYQVNGTGYYTSADTSDDNYTVS